MVLGKHPVPGRPTYLNDSRARAYCLAIGAGGGCLDIFLSSIVSFFCPPLSRGRPDIDCNIVSKGRKGQINQPTTAHGGHHGMPNCKKKNQ